MVIDLDIRYSLQRNFISHSEDDIITIKEALKINELRIDDVMFQIDSADTIQDVIDIINDN